MIEILCSESAKADHAAVSGHHREPAETAHVTKAESVPESPHDRENAESPHIAYGESVTMYAHINSGHAE